MLATRRSSMQQKCPLKKSSANTSTRPFSQSIFVLLKAVVKTDTFRKPYLNYRRAKLSRAKPRIVASYTATLQTLSYFLPGVAGAMRIHWGTTCDVKRWIPYYTVRNFTGPWPSLIKNLISWAREVTVLILELRTRNAWFCMREEI